MTAPKLALALVALALCSCSNNYCPPASELFDIADRCHSGGEPRACTALARVTEKCFKCRAFELTERNESIRQLDREQRGCPTDFARLEMWK